MSRLITILIVVCVAAGVAAVSIGELWCGIALLIVGTCILGFRRKFDWLSVLKEGGIAEPVSQHSDYSHESGGDSDGGGDSD